MSIFVISQTIPHITNPVHPNFIEVENESIFSVHTHASGPEGRLELSDSMLRESASGDLFGLSQNAGMGWSPKEMLGPQYLILNSHGGIRNEDGSPVALGYHTGHWEIGLLAAEAAKEFKKMGAVPFAEQKGLPPFF